jgi:hypothetical protein
MTSPLWPMGGVHPIAYPYNVAKSIQKVLKRAITTTAQDTLKLLKTWIFSKINAPKCRTSGAKTMKD